VLSALKRAGRNGLSPLLSRAPAGLVAWLSGFRRLQAKLTVSYLTLFILVLLGILAAVYTSVARNAERVVRDELSAGAVVFDRVWELRTAQLQGGAELLARDFGFRAAVATQDGPTIQSALGNLRARLGLDLAVVTNQDGSVLAADGLPAGVDPAALRDLGHAESPDGVFVLDGMPYQAVSAPVLAPMPLGKVIFAAKLDQQEMASLVRLSPLDFRPQVLIQGRDQRWRGGEAVSPAELAHVSKVFAARTAQARDGRPETVRIGPWIEVVLPLRSLGDGNAALLLRYPLNEALAPYRGLLAMVLLLGVAGLALVAAGSAALAREVTRPIAALRDAAERLERGEGGEVAVTGNDEIAALGLTFNRMGAVIRRREEALEQAREKAESANLAKSAFLANMSHEIRTPLNGILGMAQVMAREDMQTPQRDRLKVIHDSGETLLSILNSILDLSKIEAGHLELEQGEFDLAETVRAAAEPFAHMARDKGLVFDIVIEPAARGAWIGDALRLRQVISNLASNAVKFTEEGRILVSVQATVHGLDFLITDTGMGIAPDHLDQVFDKFSQEDTSRTRRFGGTGLGLAICRELVGLMGGRMRVTSEPGKGSTFSFSLPLERAAQLRVGGAARSDHPLRILMAEDNRTNRMILSALLAPLKADLTMVENGREAVSAAERARYDVVLMDIQMPEMNGVEATLAIRRAESDRGLPRTPILAVTANIMTHQVQEYIAAGMDAVIAKPVQAPILFAALERAISDGADAPAQAQIVG
jgi:signal transduction histidine kinase/ActR/RegA family two-component response regulator